MFALALALYMLVAGLGSSRGPMASYLPYVCATIGSWPNPEVFCMAWGHHGGMLVCHAMETLRLGLGLVSLSFSLNAWEWGEVVPIISFM